MPNFRVEANYSDGTNVFFHVERTKHLYPRNSSERPLFSVFDMNLIIDDKGNLIGFVPDEETGYVLNTFYYSNLNTDEWYICRYKQGDSPKEAILYEIKHIPPALGGRRYREPRSINSDTSTQILLASWAREIGVLETVDIMETAIMYLTGKQPDGTPLTAERIAEQPLVPLTPQE